MEKDKATNTLLAILILIAIANFIIGYILNDNKALLIKDTSDFKKQAEELRIENENLKVSIKILDKKVAERDSLLDVNKNKKTDIKNKANEKISATKSFDASMWERFFTERYQ
jgi:regulator of replication initiation timing